MAELHFTIDRFTQGRLEGQCRNWKHFPQPDMFVEFETTTGSHFVTRIVSVQTHPEKSDTLNLEMVPVLGTPDSRIEHAKFLSLQAFFKTQFNPQHAKVPIQLADLSLDLAQSDNRVLIELSDNNIHIDYLAAYQKAGYPALIIDPLGMQLDKINPQHLILGKNCHLSIQSVGIASFVNMVVDSLPASLQKEASSVLLEALPNNDKEFTTLAGLYKNPALENYPGILYQLQSLEKYGIFAKTPEEAFSFSDLKGMIQFDLSQLPMDLLPSTYEGMLGLIRHSVLPNNMQIMLAVPEAHMAASNKLLQQCCQRVTLVSFNPKTWQDNITEIWLDKTVFGESSLLVRGSITNHLEILILLNTASSQLTSLAKLEEDQANLMPATNSDMFDLDMTPPQVLLSLNEDITPQQASEINVPDSFLSSEDWSIEESPAPANQEELKGTQEFDLPDENAEALALISKPSETAPQKLDSADPDEGFYLQLEKEIPKITSGMDALSSLEMKADLSLDWSMTHLEAEEGLLATMAPDLLESVKQANLETDPQELTLEAQYQTGTTTEYSSLYVPHRPEHLDAPDLLMTSEGKIKLDATEDTEEPQTFTLDKGPVLDPSPPPFEANESTSQPQPLESSEYEDIAMAPSELEKLKAELYKMTHSEEPEPALDESETIKDSEVEPPDDFDLYLSKPDIQLPQDPSSAIILMDEDDDDMDLDFQFSDELSLEDAPLQIPEPEALEPKPAKASILDEDIPLNLDVSDLLPAHLKEAPLAEPSTETEQSEGLPVYKHQPSSNVLAFKPGQTVFHRRYGQGVVKKIITMNDEQVILNINFQDVGKRLLDPVLTHLEYAS